MVESVNAEWLRARELPPFLLLIELWTRTMQKFYERRHRQQAHPQFTTHAIKEIEKEMEQARRYQTVLASDTVAQVFLPQGQSHIVDWLASTCSCKVFQDREFPCCHSLAMARDTQLNAYTKISDWYSVSRYRATYQMSLSPIRSEEIAAGDACAAPVLLALRGRPKKQRIRRDRPEPQRAYRCSQCGQTGHTRATCRTG